MRRAAAVAASMLLAACGGDRGFAVDLTLAPNCIPVATIDRVELEVVVAPASIGGTRKVPLPGAALFGGAGKNRVALLLPDGTSRVDVLARAVDAAGALLGVGEAVFAFDGPEAQTGTLTLGNETCPAPQPDGGGFDLSAPDGEAPPDLSMPDGEPDLGGDDLTGPADLTPTFDGGLAIEALGQFGATLYEGEGSGADSADQGVAIVIHGSGFTNATVVSTDYGTLGAKYVSGDGTRIATSLALPVDPLLAAGAHRAVTISVDSQRLPLDVNGLDELVVAPAMTRPLSLATDAPQRYSRIDVGLTGTLQVSCTAGNIAFLWATGSVAGGGSISVAPSCGGYFGCTTATCTAASGPGFGKGGIVLYGGGGAGYRSTGGAGGGNSTGGVAYGTPSVFGLPGGSGGGSGNDGNIDGGRGGGVLRLHAGRLDTVAVHVDGAVGAVSGSVYGGSGSGGTLLVEAESVANMVSLSAVGGAARGANAGMGGAGSPGRIRVDVGDRAFTAQASNPPVDYNGVILAKELPTAFATPPSNVTIICNGQPFVVSVDGLQSAVLNCPSGLGATSVAVSVPAGIHTICVRNAQNGTLHYKTDHPEDRNCHPVAVAGP